MWDKHTGDLIGYVDMRDAEANYAALQKLDEVATHILVFMLRSIVNPFKFCNHWCNFRSNVSIFLACSWICENIGLKVVAITGDSAS